MFEWVPLIIATVSIMGFLFGLFKWQQSANDQKHRDMQRIFNEHKDIFEELKGRIEKNEDAVTSTRDELHRDFVRHEQQQRSNNDLQAVIGKMFNKMDGMAKDLNQLIGEFKNGK